MRKNTRVYESITLMVLMVFAVSCTRTQIYQIQHDDLPKLVVNQDTSAAAEYGMIDLTVEEDTRLSVSSDTVLYVIQNEPGGTFSKRRLIPFAFTLDEALVTPDPHLHPEGHRTAFTVHPDDRYEAHVDSLNFVPLVVTLGVFYVTIQVLNSMGPICCGGG